MGVGDVLGVWNDRGPKQRVGERLEWLKICGPIGGPTCGGMNAGSGLILVSSKGRTTIKEPIRLPLALSQLLTGVSSVSQ